jgi:NADP-dependent 3-hydroxy acid dehydrogenase YdfG
LEIVELSLTGRKILVTGSSTGIGEAVCRQAAAAGAQVAGLARSVADGDRRDGVVSFKCDVRREDDVRTGIDKAADALGGLDGIVANAGYGLYGHITKGNPADWRDVVETNVMGVLYTIYYGYKKFADSGKRDIVTMSSISGRTARLGNGVYAATKFGVNAISESLRLELTEAKVRITVIEPATVDTPFYDNSVRHEGAGIVPRTFVPLSAEDIARAVIFAMAQPEHVAINELLVRPNGQSV